MRLQKIVWEVVVLAEHNVQQSSVVTAFDIIQQINNS